MGIILLWLISRKRCVVEANGRYFGTQATCTMAYMGHFGLFDPVGHLVAKSGTNRKWASISQTVGRRAKRTLFWDSITMYNGIYGSFGPFDPVGHLVAKYGTKPEVSLYLANGVSYSQTDIILGTLNTMYNIVYGSFWPIWPCRPPGGEIWDQTGSEPLSHKRWVVQPNRRYFGTQTPCTMAYMGH
jgi:hypothetical protein